MRPFKHCNLPYGQEILLWSRHTMVYYYLLLSLPVTHGGSHKHPLVHITSFSSILLHLRFSMDSKWTNPNLTVICSFMIRIWLFFKTFWPHCGKVEFCPNTTNAGRRCPPASPWCLCHVSDCFFPLLAAAFAMPGTLYLAIYSDLISCLCRWYYAPCSDVWRWPMTNRFVKRQLKVR